MRDLEALAAQALRDTERCGNERDLDALRVQYLGKKGLLTDRLKALGTLSAEQRPAAGLAINTVKQRIQDAIKARKDALRSAALDAQLAREAIDVTLPGRGQQNGG
ncbi:MAG TPA: phenylalanine--tRNA ligase subunit alpha, partial [Gammaproteobacteria bacterium]|nr:phenylalanine--tRNA ligase subunit alpha [Gammaproteobacteria bacterium]